MLQISKYRILRFLDSSDPTQEVPTVLTKGLSTELVECWKAIKELSIFFCHIFPTISLGSFPFQPLDNYEPRHLAQSSFFLICKMGIII